MKIKNLQLKLFFFAIFLIACARGHALEISGVQIINSTSNAVVSELTDGMTLDANYLNTWNFEGVTNPPYNNGGGKVQFKITAPDGTVDEGSEGAPPFAAFGDVIGDFNAWDAANSNATLMDGNYTLEIWLSVDEANTKKTYAFTITKSPGTEPKGPFVSLIKPLDGASNERGDTMNFKGSATGADVIAAGFILNNQDTINALVNETDTLYSATFIPTRIGEYTIRFYAESPEGSNDTDSANFRITGTDLVDVKVINTADNSEQFSLSNGITLDAQLVNTWNFRGITQPSDDNASGLIHFKLTAPDSSIYEQHEGTAPFACFGDEQGVFNAWPDTFPLILGKYTLQAWLSVDQEGTKKTYQFSIIHTPGSDTIPPEGEFNYTGMPWFDAAAQIPGTRLLGWQYDKVGDGRTLANDTGIVCDVIDVENTDNDGLNPRPYVDELSYAALKWHGGRNTFQGNGQWLRYTVDFTKPLYYHLKLRIAKDYVETLKMRIEQKRTDKYKFTKLDTVLTWQFSGTDWDNKFTIGDITEPFTNTMWLTSIDSFLMDKGEKVVYFESTGATDNGSFGEFEFVLTDYLSNEKLAPSAPLGIACIDSTQSMIHLAWNPSTDNVGVEKYLVYNGPNLIAETRDTFLILQDLNCGAILNLQIRAVDYMGNVSQKSLYSAQTRICQSPYDLANIPSLPGSIDPKKFDLGGMDIAYWDTDARNGSSQFRREEWFDVANDAGFEGQGWIADKEWAEYTLKSIQAGVYRFSVHSSGPTNGAGGGIRLLLGDVSEGTHFQVIDSIFWQAPVGWGSPTWYNNIDSVIFEASDEKILRIEIMDTSKNDANVFNMYELKFDLKEDTENPSNVNGLTLNDAYHDYLKLSWNAANDDVGIKGYKVSVGDTMELFVKDTTTLVDGLQCATAYAISVQAIDYYDKASLVASRDTFSTYNCQGIYPTAAGSYDSDTFRIEAEWFDLGGHRVGYFDIDPDVVKTGYNNRVDSASVHADMTAEFEWDTDPRGNNGSMGYTGEAEWFEYTIDTNLTKGFYKVTARSAKNGSAPNGQLDIYECKAPYGDLSPNQKPVGKIAMNGTGGWSNWQDQNGGYAVLEGGRNKTIRIDFANGCNSNLNWVYFEHVPDTATPSKPSGFIQSNLSHNTVDLSWHHSTDDIMVKYYELKLGDSIWTSADTIAVLDGELLQPLTNYELEVVAIDMLDKRSEVAIENFTTLELEIDTEAPSQPQPSISNTPESITIAWNPCTDNETLSNEIKYEYSFDGGAIVSTMETTFTVSGLLCNTEHTVTISAIDQSFNKSDTTFTTSTSSCLPQEKYANEGITIAHTIPGKIEVEYYDLGGKSIAYMDSSPKQGDGAFRPTDLVDVRMSEDSVIEGSSDKVSKYVLTQTKTNDWVEYTLDDVAAGEYEMEVRMASPFNQGKMTISLDGAELTVFEALKTSAYDVFGSGKMNVTIPANGTNVVMRLAFEGRSETYSFGDVNWISFTPMVATSNILFARYKVYPNPSSTGFNVDLRLLKEEARLEVYELSGREIYNSPAVSGEVNRIDQSVFRNKGIYIIKVKSSGTTQVKRVMVK